MSDFEKELACVPASGANGLFIPWSAQLRGYDASHHRADAVGGAVAPEDLAQTIQALERLGSDYGPANSRCKAVSRALGLLCCAVLAGGALTVILAGDRSGKATGAAIAVSAAVCLLLAAGVWVCVGWASQSLQAAREERRRAASERVTDWCNKQLFRGKCVEARVSRFGAYLAFEHCGAGPSAPASPQDREWLSQ